MDHPTDKKLLSPDSASPRVTPSEPAISLDFYTFRFVFSAIDKIVFPSGQPGNILRGAFGNAFRHRVCDGDCPGARTCERRHLCAYARIFEPCTSRKGPSGLANLPRPFVFRAAYLDNRTIQPAERFWFDVHLFETKDPPLEPFAESLGSMAKDGLGPGRGRAHLVAVEQRSMSVPLTVEAESCGRLAVDFVTPTELKSGERIVSEPDFGTLFARGRDRISTLRSLYGGGPLPIDFREMGKRAGQVRTVRCDLRQVESRRRSGRTGEVHSIGGFVGRAEYEGEIAEFLPILEAACWTGVGRQCTWGKGEFRLESSSATKGDHTLRC